MSTDTLEKQTENDAMQAILDKGGNPEVLGFIHNFRKLLKDGSKTLGDFANSFSYHFALMLQQAFPDGNLYYNPESNRVLFEKGGQLYGIYGLCQRDAVYYIPIRYLEDTKILEALKNPCLRKPTRLERMNAVEAWRLGIRSIFSIKAKVTDKELTKEQVEDFAKKFLGIINKDFTWIGGLYAVCMDWMYADGSNTDSEKAYLINHPDTDAGKKVPFYLPEVRSDICLDAPTPASITFQYTGTGAMKCTLKCTDGHKGYVSTVIMTKREDNGFSWNISGWYNKIKECPPKSGWGKACLKAAVRELLSQYGKPTGITYVWNGQNDYVGQLVTEKWDGVCNTPIAVLKNESADSWDGHIYTLDMDKFLAWACPDTDGKPKMPMEYVSHITKILDENSRLTKDSPTELYRHYLYVDDTFLSDGVIPIRVPGRTMGGIKVDKRMVITGITMDNTPNICSMGQPYPDWLIARLKEFTGVELTFDSLR